MTLLISLAQKLVTAFVQLGIVNIISFFAHVHSLDFLFSQKACFHQLVQANEIWISCKGRKGLIR